MASEVTLVDQLDPATQAELSCSGFQAEPGGFLPVSFSF